jgi:hypothetical protein
MREFIWRILAAFVSQPAVFQWIVKRAKRTPYYPIYSRDGAKLYMDRWWLFNPYSKDASGGAGPARWSWLPSVRVHHICVADEPTMHDHPWNARTIVMSGWYVEERPNEHRSGQKRLYVIVGTAGYTRTETRSVFNRQVGYTGRVLFEQYHRISDVSPGGVYTLWFTWKYRGTWGFLVNGKKVPWREYLQ